MGVVSGLGDASVCGCCLVDFRTRPRLVKHLKYRSQLCARALALWNVPLSEEEAAALDAEDEASRKELAKVGKTETWAELPCRRVQGPQALFHASRALDAPEEGQ